MKKRKLFQFFATALALAFVGCSHDALTGDDPEGDQNGPKDAVYMNVTVQLPVAGGMGGRSITNTGTNGDYGTSTSGTEIGKDHENVVNTVLLVLAEKGTYKIIACGTQNGFATPSDGKIKTVQSIEKSKLSQYYTNTDNGDGNGTLKSGKEKINVYVFCNPTLRLQTKLKGLSSGAEWIDETGKVIESDKGVFPTTTEQDGGAVWGGSDHKQGFLMATAKSNDIEKEIPKTLSGWDNHNTAEKAFDLTGPNYLGSSSEIDNGKTNNIEVGSIDVERAVARFDFKDGSPLASTSPCTYDVVTYKDNNEDKTLIQIELTKMALVNMSKEFYYLRRVSNDGSDKVPGFPETNTNNFAYCGVETLSNYVVDTDPTFKTGTLEKKGKVYASHFNFCLGDTTLTNMWTINENARGQWYTSEISDVLDGLDDTDDGWNATDKIWRYVTENTIPTDVANQKHGISTGIVFKGKMVVPDALRGSEKYGELYNTINNAGDVLTGNPNEDPILYAHSGNLYLTWKEVRAVAIDNKESYPAFYNAVFGTVSEEEDKQPKAAAEGAALVAQKLRLVPQGLGQGVQLAEGPVQPEIRHHIAELRPLQLPAQQGKIRQHLGGGGDEIQPGIGPAQVLQQQVRVDDDSVLRAGAFRQQAAQPVAAGVRQVLRPQQGVAEGQPGGDAVFPGQGQHLPGVPVPGPHPAASPDAVRRCAIQGGDAAPIVKILPVRTIKRQKRRIQVIKFKQTGQMKQGCALVRCFHSEDLSWPHRRPDGIYLLYQQSCRNAKRSAASAKTTGAALFIGL